MPLRGENVGTAYVRILADGRDLDDSIREMFDDTDGTMEGAGRRGSQKYADGFAEEVKKGKVGNLLNDSLRNALIEGDFLNSTFFHDKKWTSFRKGLADEFGDAGRLAGQRMEQELLRTGIDGLGNILPQINSRIIDAQKELLIEQKRADREAEKEGREHAAAITENLRRAEKEQEAIQRRGMLIERALTEDRHRSLIKLREDFALLNREAGQFLSGNTKDAQPKRDQLALIAKIRVEMDRLNYKNEVWVETLRDQDNALRRMHPRLERFDRGLLRLGDHLGTVTGRGSRNNFLNFIGSLTRNFTNLVTLVPRLAIKVGTTMADAFTKAGGGLSGVVASLGSLVPLLGTAAAGFVALGIAVGILVIVIGPIIALLSGLLGIVTALVATLAFGLVGALGAVVGALVPLVAGLGVFIIGMKNLDGESKKAASGIIKSFKDLGDAAVEGLLFDRTAVSENHNHTVSSFADVLRRVQGMVKDLRPIVVEVGRGMADALDIVTERLTRPGGAWTRFISAMTGKDGELGFLAVQARRVSVSIGNILGGVLGLLVGMRPIIREFTDWLQNITKDFDEWANSAEGQNEIREFFEDAADSAKALGGFLGDVWGFLAQILDAGRGTGDSIFKSMGDQIERFSKYLDDHPDALRDWFVNARELASALGTGVLMVGKLIDALDNPTSRKALLTLIGLAEHLSGVLEFMWKVSGVHLLYSAYKKLTGGIEGVGTAVGNLLPPNRQMKDSLDQITGAATRATRALILQRLETAGLLDIATNFGVNTRDLIGASLGHESAVKRVNKALKDNNGLLDTLEANKIREFIGETTGEFDKQSGAVRDAWGALSTWGEVLEGIKRKKLRLEIKTLGADATLRDLDKLQKQYDLAPKKLRLVAEAVGIDLTKKQIKDLMQDGINFAKDPYKATLTADDRRARSIISSTDQLLANLTNADYTANIDVVSNAASVAFETRRILANLPDEIIHLRTVRTGPGGQGGGYDGPTAAGGLFSGPSRRLIGEAGPEAVVPLNRDLSKVDPAVRWLSAIAQGKMPTGGGKTIDASGWTIVSPTADPFAVATEVVNSLVASAYSG